MGLYIWRAVKYLLKLLIMIALALYVLAAFDLLNVQAEMVLQTIFSSWRGVVLLGAVVVFSLAYPKISFGKADVRGDLAAGRESVTEAFRAYRYSLAGEEDGVMVFRADSMIRRLLWQFDDAVKVYQHGDYIRIDGTKKIVPRVELRLNAYLSEKNEQA